MSRFNDLTGKTFGRLSVLRRLSEDEGAKRGCPKWLCQCECGKITHTASTKLVSGLTKSCGCLGLENATKAKIKHGDARFNNHTRLYRIWAAMHRRCNNPNVAAWKYYGGKGVKVCKTWKNYALFKKWALSNGYENTLTIDRINPSKDYTPKNCRWVTFFENRSRAHKK